jgi:hypothetical protein
MLFEAALRLQQHKRDTRPASAGESIGRGPRN